MENSRINKYYLGIFNDEENVVKIDSFFMFLKNNQDKTFNEKTNLFICSNNKQQALTFATNTARYIKEENLGGACKIVSFEELKDTQEEVLILNGFDGFDLNAFVEETKKLNKIIIVCTTKGEFEKTFKDKQLFFENFLQYIVLKPYTLDDIWSCTEHCYEVIKEQGKLDYDDTFLTALKKYVHTVYPRAIFKDEAFVSDLLKRVDKVSREKDSPNLLSDKTIPLYREKPDKNEVEDEIRRCFSYCEDTNKIINYVNYLNEANKLDLTTIKINHNIVLKSSSFNLVKDFASAYAKLLYANDLIASEDVYEENESLDNKYGVVLIRENDKIEDLLLKIDKYSNQLAFVLYKDKDEDDELSLSFIREFDLDKKNEKTIDKFIDYICETRRYERSVDKKLATDILMKSSNMDKAIEDLEKYLVNSIENPEEVRVEKPKKEISSFNHDFDDVKKKEEELTELVKNIPDDKDEINVLLLAMSTLQDPKRINVGQYAYKGVEAKYLSQMEPVPKMLTELLAKDNKKLNKIFVLNTKATLLDGKDMAEYGIDAKKYSAFSYFKERCSFIGEDNIVGINLFNPDDDETNLGRALYEFYEEMIKFDKKVNLYVDIHGGLRDSFTVVDAILMLLKDMENINVRSIYAVDFNHVKKVSEIRKCNDQFNIFNFVGGMNEFLNFGRSAGLVEFNKKNNKDKDNKLVATINKISDGILLNRTNVFEDNLSKLKENINGINEEHGYFDIVKEMIKNDYKVTIGNRYYDLLENDGDELIAQLQWCINKKHYQQALILIENRSASYLVKKNVLKDCDPYKKIDDVWGDWAKYSLCYEPGTIWVNVKSNENENTASNNVKNRLNIKEEFYFNTFTDHFNGIRILNNNIDPIKEITKLKNNNQKDHTKYRGYIEEKTDDAHIFVYKEINKQKKYKKRYESNRTLIPVYDKIAKNEKALEKLYILLYLYKGLKKYRNTVAHPNENKNNNNNNVRDLTTEEVGAWVQLYINVLQDVINSVSNNQNK